MLRLVRVQRPDVRGKRVGATEQAFDISLECIHLRGKFVVLLAALVRATVELVQAGQKRFHLVEESIVKQRLCEFQALRPLPAGVVVRVIRLIARKVLGWPKRCKLARAILWEYNYM